MYDNQNSPEIQTRLIRDVKGAERKRKQEIYGYMKQIIQTLILTLKHPLIQENI